MKRTYVVCGHSSGTHSDDIFHIFTAVVYKKKHCNKNEIDFFFENMEFNAALECHKSFCFEMDFNISCENQFLSTSLFLYPNEECIDCKLSWQQNRPFRTLDSRERERKCKSLYKINTKSNIQSDTTKNGSTKTNINRREWKKTLDSCQDNLNIHKTSYTLGHFQIGYCNCGSGRVSLVFIRRNWL